MTAFALRLIALTAMLIDHSGIFLHYKLDVGGQVYIILRSIGRIAMPLYCYMLVNGFRKTRDSVSYLSRLCLLSALSQIPYTLATASRNYSLSAPDMFSLRFPPLLIIPLIVLTGLAWYFFVRRDASYLTALVSLIAAMPILSVGGAQIFGERLNVFYVLALSLASLCVTKRIRENGIRSRGTVSLLAVLIFALILISPHMGYGIGAVIFVVMLYLCDEGRISEWLIIAIWCFYQYPPTGTVPYLVCSLLSIVPVMLYKGRQGKSAKAFFYAIYPVHLLIIGCAALIL